MTGTRVLSLIAAMIAAVAAVAVGPMPVAAARPVTAPYAFAGMTIIQGGSRCTLGYLETVERIAYSAGHCDDGRIVKNTEGQRIGVVMESENNRGNHSATGPSDTVVDYEVISIDPDVTITSRLGPELATTILSDPAIAPKVGMAACHYGEASGDSCGEIAAVYDGWFTMKAGTMPTAHGDSGGPIYTYSDTYGGKPVLIGLLRGRNGARTAGVSWPQILQATRG